MSKILIVEDDTNTANMLHDWLKMDGHVVEEVYDGFDAIYLAENYTYDIIILDWELPQLSGIEILQRYRAICGNTPVLILTGRNSLSDKELGFNVGADDYLTKPFEMKELSVRVRALLRRSRSICLDTITCGKLSINTAKKEVFCDGVGISLKPKEYAILELLMRHPGEIFSAEILLNQIWKSDSESSELAVRTHITRLRQKIDVAGQPSLIDTVHGFGYKLRA